MPKAIISEQGFSLFEVLVAVIVLGVSLVTVFQLFSGGLNASMTAGNYTNALFHARSKMEEMLLYDRLAEKDISGDIEGGYTWHALVQWVPSEMEDGKKKTKYTLDMFQITVKVNWQERMREKEVMLKTLTIAQKIDDSL